MRVGVTGATGFVGRAVVAALRRRGDAVVALTRDPSTARMPYGVDVVAFDVNDPKPQASALEGMDAIVHLAGESVDGRWTPAKKQRIFDSRVSGTRKLASSLSSLARRPRVLVSASAIGYYGNREDEVLDDASPPGHDFLAGVCVAWEREALAATKLGIRVALLRTAMVVGPGGALAKLQPIFRFGIGGPLGSGKQWMPWIHLDDLADMYCFIIDREDMHGPIAGVAPDVATNARFMQALGHAMHRPALAPAPGFALKAVLGEFAQTLLGGQLIMPNKTADAGFAWRHGQLEAALIAVVAPGSGRTPALQTFRSDQFVRAPMEKVFSFFSDAANLAKLTPPAMQLKMQAASSDAMRRGATIEYALKVKGVSLRWRALILEWTPNVRFVDTQVRGPYLVWRHTHEFERRDDGVVVRDRVEYALPFAPPSDVMLPAIRRDIEHIFSFRRRAIEEIFAA